MKKVFVTFLIAALALSMTSALAAGKLSVTEEDFYVIDSYSLYGYVFAKVENVGDRPIKVNAGILEIFDTEGDVLTSTDYIDANAEYLQPDEYTYISASTRIEDVTAEDVDDYMLTVTGKSEDDYINLRLPCTTEYQADVQEGYSTHNYMYATVTNDTDAPVYKIEIVLALLDADGKILYMDEDSMYNKGLMPGSSIVVRVDVSSSFIELFEKEGLTPASVDAIAFTRIENE